MSTRLTSKGKVITKTTTIAGWPVKQYVFAVRKHDELFIYFRRLTLVPNGKFKPGTGDGDIVRVGRTHSLALLRFATRQKTLLDSLSCIYGTKLTGIG